MQKNFENITNQNHHLTPGNTSSPLAITVRRLGLVDGGEIIDIRIATLQLLAGTTGRFDTGRPRRIRLANLFLGFAMKRISEIERQGHTEGDGGQDGPQTFPAGNVCLRDVLSSEAEDKMGHTAIDKSCPEEAAEFVLFGDVVEVPTPNRQEDQSRGKAGVVLKAGLVVHEMLIKEGGDEMDPNPIHDHQAPNPTGREHVPGLHVVLRVPREQELRREADDGDQTGGHLGIGEIGKGSFRVEESVVVVTDAVGVPSMLLQLVNRIDRPTGHRQKIDQQFLSLRLFFSPQTTESSHGKTKGRTGP